MKKFKCKNKNGGTTRPRIKTKNRMMNKQKRM